MKMTSVRKTRGGESIEFVDSDTFSATYLTHKSLNVPLRLFLSEQ
ncbi:MAG: hypothetical protein ACOCOD_07130 [Prevotella sp.]